MSVTVADTPNTVTVVTDEQVVVQQPGMMTPPGADTHVPFNDSGDWGYNSQFTFDKSTMELSVPRLTGLDLLGMDVLAGLDPSLGQITWNADDECLNVGMNGPILQVGQEAMAKVRNVDSVDITNGQAVMFAGATGQRPNVMRADQALYPQYTVAVATEDIAKNGTGFVTTFGFVRGIDTSALTEGGIVYLDSTAGELTTTPPTGHRAVIGACVYQHSSQGILFVRINATAAESHQGSIIYRRTSGIGDLYGTLDWTIDETEQQMVALGFRLANGYWEDVKSFVHSGKLAGVSDPSLDVFRGNTRCYAFSASEEIHIPSVQFPHAWRQVSPEIHPHVHWSPSDGNTGNVRWGIEYTYAAINEQFPVSTATQYILAAAGGNDHYHLVHEGTPISPSPFGISMIFGLRIFRDGGHADDTYPSKAFLRDFDFHALLDTRGSRQEYVK